MGLSLEIYIYHNIPEPQIKRLQLDCYSRPVYLRLETCILKKKATLDTRQIKYVQLNSSKTSF